jgi:hypothetical protein
MQSIDDEMAWGDPAGDQRISRIEWLIEVEVKAQALAKTTFGPLQYQYEALWHAAETLVSLEAKEAGGD